MIKFCVIFVEVLVGPSFTFIFLLLLKLYVLLYILYAAYVIIFLKGRLS